MKLIILLTIITLARKVISIEQSILNDDGNDLEPTPEEEQSSTNLTLPIALPASKSSCIETKTPWCITPLAHRPFLYLTWQTSCFALETANDTTPLVTTTSTASLSNSTTTSTTTPVTVSINTTTTASSTQTTTVVTTQAPTAAPTTREPGRRFDGLSFIGGMILATGVIALSFLAIRHLRRSKALPYSNLR